MHRSVLVLAQITQTCIRDLRSIGSELFQFSWWPPPFASQLGSCLDLSLSLSLTSPFQHKCSTLFYYSTLSSLPTKAPEHRVLFCTYHTKTVLCFVLGVHLSRVSSAAAASSKSEICNDTKQPSFFWSPTTKSFSRKNSRPQLKEYGGGDGIMIPQTAPALLSLNKNLFCKKHQLKKNGGDNDGITFPQNVPALLLSLNKTYFCKKNLSSSKMVEMGILIPQMHSRP